ncbi:NHL repeat-containing protein [Thermosipho atlanticus]|uniref:Arylesterase n=1 Tax=Thermosipho atlanticus DSM 15807 TaxID=1123380 RepID=A0A1M5TQK3_9BACT|nr:hypothetical protein [Thermosipho atlanticus]SHH52876.1 Arylesterase [Thermosipho atlanticus DSM 15807]
MVLLTIIFTIWGLLGPESIAIDNNGGFYISQMGKLYETDGSIIYQISDQTKKFFQITDPKGILLENNILWIAENDRLIMLNTLNSDYKTFTSVSGLAKYLNDIVRFNGTLYVTDTYSDMVYTLKSDMLQPVFTLSRPNGITTDGKYLYIVSFTNPAIVYKSDGKRILEKITLPDINLGDGISYDKENDIFFISGFGSGNVVAYKNWKKVGEIDKFSGPSDIYYDSERKTLYVPDLKSNKVYILKVMFGE